MVELSYPYKVPRERSAWQTSKLLHKLSQRLRQTKDELWDNNGLANFQEIVPTKIIVPGHPLSAQTQPPAGSVVRCLVDPLVVMGAPAILLPLAAGVQAKLADLLLCDAACKIYCGSFDNNIICNIQSRVAAIFPAAP